MQLDLGGTAFFVLREMLKANAVFKFVILFHAGTTLQGAVALVHKGGKAHKQRVDKLVFVGEIAFLVENVQDARGSHLVPLDLQDQIGVLCQVLDGFLGNAPRQLNGHNVLLILDRHGGIAYDQIQGGQSRLYARDPFGVDAFAHGALSQRRLGFPRADQHTRLLEIGVLVSQCLQGGEGLGSELLVFSVHIPPSPFPAN